MFQLKEAADYLHLPVRAIERLARDHALPVHARGDRFEFRKGDLDAWASRHLLDSKPERLSDYHARASARQFERHGEETLIEPALCLEALAPVLSCRTRASVVREMVALAARTNRVWDEERLLTSVEARERRCSTALSGGVALLHPEREETYLVEDYVVAVACMAQPIAFGAPDGAWTDLFFLVCCPDERCHLHLLARLCMMCRETDVIVRLHEASTAEAMRDALATSERNVLSAMPQRAGRS